MRANTRVCRLLLLLAQRDGGPALILPGLTVLARRRQRARRPSRRRAARPEPSPRPLLSLPSDSPPGRGRVGRIVWNPHSGGSCVAAFCQSSSRVLALGLVAASSPSFAQESLDIGRYVEIVLRSHPRPRRARLSARGRGGAKERAGLPGPGLAYSRDRATRPGTGSGATETAYSVSQTIPGPARSAPASAPGPRRDVLRAGADGVRWELTSRLDRPSRASSRLAPPRLRPGAEEDARSLRDLVTRRTELGEFARVGPHQGHGRWLRQQRDLATAEREAEAAEAVVRALASSRSAGRWSSGR